FSYNAWAAHPGWFHLYITKDGYDPTQPLAWDDLESEPFATIDHPSVDGQVGTIDGQYKWNTQLPAGKTGKHIIYSVWERSDSNETFYGCSDVVFDGGNGEVTGVGDQGGDDGGGDDGGGDDGGGDDGEPTPVPDGQCTVSQRTAGSWNTGYQAEVTVKNSGTTPIQGWMVHATLSAGQSVNNAWNAQLGGSGTAVTFDNADWNGSLAPGASTSFGYVVNGGTAPTAPELSCMVVRN
ncbi:MAG TPA: chitin-binding protein, partial [Streptomyces sp.]|nr:chitin-binding protein [Streptomyces sp.]